MKFRFLILIFIFLELNTHTENKKFLDIYPIEDSKKNYFGYPSTIYYKANINELRNLSLLKPISVLYYGYMVPKQDSNRMFSLNAPNRNILIVQIFINQNINAYVFIDFTISNDGNYSNTGVNFNKISYDVDFEYLLDEFNINIKKIPANFQNNYPNFQYDFKELVKKAQKQKK